MSKKVIIKEFPFEVGGKLVKVNEECRLPDGLADAMAARGRCTIVDAPVKKAAPAAKKPAPKKKAAKKKGSS